MPIKLPPVGKATVPTVMLPPAPPAVPSVAPSAPLVVLISTGPALLAAATVTSPVLVA